MRKVCSRCKKEKETTEFYRNITTKDGLSYECKTCKNYNAQKWKHTYRAKEENRIKEKDYKKRYHKRSNIRLKRNISNRIRKLVKNKSRATIDLIGCPIEDLKLHLQKTASMNGYNDFDVNNYDGHKYHIDHILPCSAFNLKCSYHQKLCFHYTNLQILSATCNLRKYNKTS